MAERLCPWWIRWYHRRLRRFDRWHVYAALTQLTDSAEKVEWAWTLHKNLPGQEHWRCPCAAQAEQTGRD